MSKLSQNDLIFIIVSIVVGLGLAITFIFTAPQPVSPAAAPTVASGRAKLPDANPTLAAALPGGSSNSASGTGAFSGFGGPPAGALGGRGGAPTSGPPAGAFNPGNNVGPPGMPSRGGKGDK